MLTYLCRTRYFLLIIQVFVLFVSSITYANESETPNDASGDSLELNTRVIVPPAWWTTEPDANEAFQEAPSKADTPALPLEPPPIQRIRIMLDWFLSPQHAGLIIAQQRGLFAAQGMEVELQTPADPTIALKLLAADEVDFALSRQPALHLYAHNGAPVVRIATLIETPLRAVVVSGELDEPIKEDLATLRYGYSTREGRDLFIPLIVPDALTQSGNLAPPANLHFDARRAFEEEQVDAVVDAPFQSLPAQLASEGINTRVIRHDALDIPRYDGLVLLANRDGAARRADTWAQVVAAIEKAHHWMLENPDAAWQLLIDAEPVLDNPINADNWPDMLRRIALSPGAVNNRRYHAFERFLQEEGVTQEQLPVSRLAIDPHAL
ncbi:putative hydroxymethylpyrimidine transport system substrate-binding protein [Vreelandella arcis]|uniref:Putative hydroxymethylpyrimidine transport system substrate-binding protein n=1 Tax=Vreelandella arcis TaxID=416873 RepID=A0A1G9YSN7_9GAMM|nr:putative hydroxymethylpyrimidine transport system substrate-binding protein [Halomonas arcis]